MPLTRLSATGFPIRRIPCIVSVRRRAPIRSPTLVRQLQSVIGREARAQMLERAGRLPDVVVACVGGGSNAIGMLHPFVEDEGVRLVGVEAGGTGEPGCYNSAPINLGSPGVLHGHVTMLLQDENGQIQPSHSISAGLDYPGVGPEHAYLAETGRVHYGVICDASALNAFQTLTREEGIIPALESSHAVAWVLDHAEELPHGGTSWSISPAAETRTWESLKNI